MKRQKGNKKKSIQVDNSNCNNQAHKWLPRYEIARNKFLEDPNLRNAQLYFYLAVNCGIDISPRTHKELFDIIAELTYKDYKKYSNRQSKAVIEKMNKKKLHSYPFVMEKVSIAKGHKNWEKHPDCDDNITYTAFYKKVHSELILAAKCIYKISDEKGRKGLLGNESNIEKVSCEALIARLQDHWNSDEKEFNFVLKHRKSAKKAFRK